MPDLLRILHLEDDPLDRELIEAKLAEEGIRCKIRCVDTREAFLRAIEGDQVDIILADYKLPAFDGLAALEIARKSHPDIPFIVVSGTMGEDPAIETMKCGATDYVLKQKLTKLAPAIRRALQEVERRRELAQSEKMRRDTLHRLELQIRCMPLACIVWDPEYVILEWNPAAETVFGWSAGEAIGKNMLELIIPVGEREERAALLAKTFVQEAELHSVNVNVAKSGRNITCEWFRTPFRDESGKTLGVLSMANDITKRVELERQLQVAQRMEAVGTLAGGVAHDFNNSLTGIIGFGEMLRPQLVDQANAKADLEEILRCADRAARLTRQLLIFARRQIIEPVNLNINAVVDDLMKLIRNVVGEHIEVKTFLEKALPTTKLDRSQLEQVLMNLCLNARDAMPGGGQLIVETSLSPPMEELLEKHPYMVKSEKDPNMGKGGYAVLSVTDSGMGMDEKTRARAFEPFFSTKSPDKGTGLGLAVVYGIVKQHNGFIYLYSEPGKGTTFRIYFPSVDAVPETPVRAAQGEILGGKEMILIAEDEENVRRLMVRGLEKYGYRVLVAENGADAVETFRKHGEEIALAVLDVVMPKMGGKQAYEEMVGMHPGLKALFLSGYSANAVHEGFILHPGFAFLQKPFGPAVLARKVREILDGR